MNRGLLIRFGVLMLLVFGAFHVAKASACRDACQDQYFSDTDACEEVYGNPDSANYQGCMTGAALVWSWCVDGCYLRFI